VSHSVDQVAGLTDRLSTWILYTTPIKGWPLWLLPLVGFVGLDFEDAKEQIDKVIKYIRVSSESQKDKSGKERQETPLQNEIAKLNVEEVFTIADEWESARTMLRENVEEVLDIVAGDEESTYCLMLEDVDRLSRAEPFEACVFFWIAKEHDLILYFDNLEYFDLSDPDQQLSIFFGLYQSRREYLKISEQTSSGQKSVKEDGGLPGPAPYGYEKLENTNILQICEEEAEVIREGVTQLLDTEAAIISVWRNLEDKYGDSDVNFPAYSTFLDILRREFYTGRIRHDGKVVGECPQILSDEEFESVQQIVDAKNREEHDEELDHILKSVIEQFEVDTSLELFDVIKGRCPECGGDVETWGSTKRLGHRVRRYRCENEACDFTGALLSEKKSQRWENRLPILCPLCQTPADDADWEQSTTKIGAIEQTCDECGREYSIDLSEELTDGLKRGLEFPEYAISWFDNDDDGSEAEANETANSSFGEKDDEANDRDDENQRGLDDFD
jgi:DNA invertase Pin-like site-specific DNA recombinase